MATLTRKIGKTVGVGAQTLTTFRSIPDGEDKPSFLSGQFYQTSRMKCTVGTASALELRDPVGPTTPPPEKSTIPTREPALPKALVCGGASRGTQVLTFYTWWNENGKRQTMTMHLNPETKVWRVKVDIPIMVRIYTRDGELVGPWDVHVGARLDVLGRLVTLKQASLPTLCWLDSEARKLVKEKLELEAELCKFTHVRFTALVQQETHSHEVVLNPKLVQGGKLNLRGLQNEVACLEHALSQYRAPPEEEEEREEAADLDAVRTTLPFSADNTQEGLPTESQPPEAAVDAEAAAA